MKKRNDYKRYRFPAEIIQYAVWLYFRFSMSYRDIEDLLAERGISVSYETIRRWLSLPQIHPLAYLDICCYGVKHIAHAQSATTAAEILRDPIL